ncbi:HigA family addiction module antitoxin [Kluyvera ascorbata]|uniref:Addiction module antidote protein, HigA family n=1 Tax=Kluyvera ascorbata TaxID=51288 RepID=A0A3N2S3W8_9ENTR|nr:HigA family addiction module antitoxin [Kluyvera ascorbata]BBV66616.1 putative HTH-type transcriptional regulator YbaQ [Klebsiella sp. STW0522-44]MDT8700294.1 HigA family addiction module antitoxin [Kluyvera ascorbata]MDU3911011.1 HigA family addiction module antitoxin [Kluyvera ascorbata]MDZ4030127.1 HigA family addiction module antitoxin [Kluyvera ascorbata]MEB6386758.1 HigA family addiction module antitoxin [Kluyvera ascorbata]
MNQATRKPTTVGDILLFEYLEPLDLKINDLAEMLQVHRNTVSALVNNNRKLTIDMAFRLAKAFDTSAAFWINLQAAVDVWETENDARLQVELNKIITAEDFLAARAKANEKAA